MDLEGELSFIDACTFFMSFKVSWIKRYATDRLDDHWADIIDEKLKMRRNTRLDCFYVTAILS